MCGAVLEQTTATLHYSWARSLKNKMDELRLCAEDNFKGCESCTMVFTEKWLHQDLTLFVSWKDFLTYALTGVFMSGKNKVRHLCVHHQQLLKTIHTA